MSLQFPLAFLPTSAWVQVERCHPEARALADRHYSRQQPGAVDFMPPGRTFVLLSRCGRAVWGVVENLDPAGAVRWRCSIFRNEGAGRSSELVELATIATLTYWQLRHGKLPAVRLSTEIDARAVRHKRDPGRCFRRAGWTVRGWTAGGHGRHPLLVLDAPGERERVPALDAIAPAG